MSTSTTIRRSPDRLTADIAVETHSMAVCPFCSKMLIGFSPDCEIEHGPATASFARRAGLFGAVTAVNNHLAGIARYTRSWHFVAEIGVERTVTEADLRTQDLLGLVESHLGLVNFTGTIRLYPTGASLELTTEQGCTATFEVVGTPCW
jgi:hypothetical protein